MCYHKMRLTTTSDRCTMRNTSLPTAALFAPDTAVFLRMGAVMRLTGLGRSTIYRLVASDKFPPPVRLADRAVAWRRSDIDRWSAERPVAIHSFATH